MRDTLWTLGRNSTVDLQTQPQIAFSSLWVSLEVQHIAVVQINPGSNKQG